MTFNYWSRFRESSYRFSEVLDDESFKTHIGQAIQLTKDSGKWDESKVPQTLIDRRGREVSSVAFLGRQLLPRHRIRGKGSLMGPAGDQNGGGQVDYPSELKDKIKPIIQAPEGVVWISEEVFSGKGLGEEVEAIPGHGVMVSDEVGWHLEEVG